jgi:LacI family transcriptional regulator
LAAEYLLKLGHRQCAYLGLTTGSVTYTTGYRGHAFRAGIEEAGGTVQMLMDPALTLVAAGMNSPNEPVLGKLIDQLLAATPRPTVLLVHADMYTPSVYRHLLERGIQPGKDITIVTCNNERPYLIGLKPAPVVIDLHGEIVGRRAVDQLLWRIEHPTELAMKVMVEPDIVEPE